MSLANLGVLFPQSISILRSSRDCEDCTGYNHDCDCDDDCKTDEDCDCTGYNHDCDCDDDCKDCGTDDRFDCDPEDK